MEAVSCSSSTSTCTAINTQPTATAILKLFATDHDRSVITKFVEIKEMRKLAKVTVIQQLQYLTDRVVISTNTSR
jgi:hypothetical protein